MDAILNITNGDSAVTLMKEVGIPGRILPWRDVLHDGPVPDDLSLEKLSEVRVQYLAGQGWGEPGAIRRTFTKRDKELQAYHYYEKVLLWFEHDLYDQLQILQILDWFADNYQGNTKLAIICTEQYLGMATHEQLKALFAFEEEVTEKHLMLAKKAWSAFRSRTPEKWQQLLNEDTSALPFLSGAVQRLLEEYPDCQNGLSRTAQKALEIISRGEKRPGRIFGCYQETEERRFMGDTSFWVILHQLLESRPALIKLPPGKQLTLSTTFDQELSITTAGEEVLAGKRNWLEMVAIDRWIGGVHLTHNNVWCWTPKSRIINKI